MIILGISSYFHDSAMCLLKDGEILFSLHEERLTRIKHDKDFPRKAIESGIKKYNLKLEDLDHIVFFDKPFLKFERLLETYTYYSPFEGFKSFKKSIPLWIKEKLFQRDLIINELKSIFNEKNKNDIEKKLVFSEHHISHAASAFYPSNFEESAIITMDGVGEWSTTTFGVGKKNKIEILKEIKYPHSLGLLYSAFTYFLGFEVNSGEYKVMGLAPFGEPKYFNLIIDKLLEVKEDGSFILNQEYFNYSVGLTMTNSKFDDLFKIKRRNPSEDLSQIHMDIAASIQKTIEFIIIKICKYVKKTTKMNNLCLSGGVALNCVANYKIGQEKIFNNIWVQPASGDAGSSIGAAMYLFYHILNNTRKIDNFDKMKGCYLGNDYSQEEIKKDLDKFDINYNYLDENKLLRSVSEKLSNGKIIGWFQGRSEFGPRALGSRSILADPRPIDMLKKLNLKIKYRESFRPFAPSILSEFQKEWFDSFNLNQYMSFVSKTRDFEIDKNEKFNGLKSLDHIKSKIKAVTHLDGTSRVQTVFKKLNPKFYGLIENFYKITGIPLIINTSFNVRGEPIVETPKDAIKCFLGTEMDYLIIDNFIICKTDQNKNLITTEYSLNFIPD
tara:strand:+ start:138 stop:1973 length:1836 start_codon:yes stop_codon:yes gene_type:complete